MQISKTLSDLYIQEWHTKVASSSKGKTHNLFKHDVHFENYLTKFTVCFLNIRTAKKLVVNSLKFVLCGSTIE